MFTDAIKIEQRRIQRLIDLSPTTEEEHGSLYVKEQDNSLYAYERWKGDKIYLGGVESARARELFAAHFNEKRLACLRHDRRLLEKLERQYKEYDFDSVVSDMNKSCRMAAKNNTFEHRYEEIRKWAQAPYPKNPYPFPDSENYAKDGTRLRSKGECIWYNLMQERGILFRYECEVKIVDRNGKTKILYPDFLVLCYDGTMIIIEHLGGMGERSYAIDFGEKSCWYFQKGFVLGKNYFVTSDDPNHGTDSQMIARLVDRVEEMFYGF